ncbi:hypothetical protein MBEHAL_0811 [Halarchaeum acidiphilum MH1-52-1]|uniref:Uncharacterized protein n=1 Tax=Halarchaeum acidiphilum MH1-52-1 TaxID=1261545 RepID=U2YE80_9EURY|nr:DUF6339 family protein [Halarchaeum acidiphilum]GAD52051.1 hypothetical protein MBEHAL_0811 [Halarchaeum acidiphilum MH1-52-1]
MSEDRLTRLDSGARTLLEDDPGFLRGEEGSKWLNEDDLSRYTHETDYTADLDSLGDRLQDIVDEYSKYTGEMDTKAAKAVHEEIDLSRAAASDSGIWNALAMKYYPWFVRHRWKYESKTGMKKKFWTYGAALDSNSSTFERLWWIAELTHEGDDYTNTRRAFRSRRFCFRVFDIQLGRYKPAALALLDVLYDEENGSFVSNDIIDGTVKRFRRAGSTVPLEARTQDELVPMIQGIREDVKEATE